MPPVILVLTDEDPAHEDAPGDEGLLERLAPRPLNKGPHDSLREKDEEKDGADSSLVGVKLHRDPPRSVVDAVGRITVEAHGIGWARLGSAEEVVGRQWEAESVSMEGGVR